MKRKWPDKNTLTTWWIYHKIQNATLGELDDPEVPHHWMREFSRMGPHAVHLELYSLYNDYRLEYVNPNYADELLQRQTQQGFSY